MTTVDGIKGYFRSSRPVVVPALFLIVLVSANQIQKSGLDAVYFADDRLPHHMVWHSAYTGLDLHPEWPDRMPYKQLAGLSGDALPAALSKILFDEKGIPFTTRSGGMRWRMHEDMVRSAYLEFLQKNPVYSLQLFLYHKPRKLLGILQDVVPSIPPAAGGMAAAAFAMSIALLSAGRGIRLIELLLAIGLLFLCSLAPSLWAYPAPHVMADQLWSSLFLCMSVTACGVAAVAGRLSVPASAGK